IFETLEQMNYIVIINKVDLEQKIEMDTLKKLSNGDIITTSLIKDEGISELETALSNLFFSNQIMTENEMYVSNIRHIQLLKEAKIALEEARNALSLNMPLDIVQIDVTRTW